MIKIIGFIVLLLVLFNLIVFIIFQIGSLQGTVIAYSPWAFILNIGIWKRNRIMVLPFFYSGIALCVIITAAIVIAGVAVAHPESDFFNHVKSIFHQDNSKGEFHRDNRKDRIVGVIRIV